jgi:hypothetical protein
MRASVLTVLQRRVGSVIVTDMRHRPIEGDRSILAYVPIGVDGLPIPGAVIAGVTQGGVGAVVVADVESAGRVDGPGGEGANTGCVVYRLHFPTAARLSARIIGELLIG